MNAKFFDEGTGLVPEIQKATGKVAVTPGVTGSVETAPVASDCYRSRCGHHHRWWIARRPRAGARPRSPAPPGSGWALRCSWFSLLVLIPLTAVLGPGLGGRLVGVLGCPDQPADPGRARGSPSVRQCSSPLVNVVMGTAIAWVLVRDHFPGKQLLEVVIDIPFALPTIVAGLVLLSLYGPSSPLGLNWANTRDRGVPGVLVRDPAVHRPNGASRC